MSQETSDRRNDATPTRELDPTKQNRAIVDEHVLGAVCQREAEPDSYRTGEHADRQASAERVANPASDRQRQCGALPQPQSQRGVDLAENVH